MADKQVNFPIGLVPSWANDLNLDDPGEPWNNTPTKVEPGAGKRDDGYLPEENPPAQTLNKQLNELGKWVQYFSAIQVMNWFDSGLIGGANATGESMVYDEGIGSWLWGGRADTFVNSRDGQTFSAAFSSGSGFTWEIAATKLPDEPPTHTGARSIFMSHSTVGALTVVEFDGGFNTQVLPHVGTAIGDGMIWDSINSLWLAGGREDMGGTPTTVFWSDATTITGFTKNTPAVAANSVEIIHMAHGEDGVGGALNLAVGAGVAPSFDVWTSTNGTLWSPATPTGITAGEDARSIMWDPARLLFVLLTNDSCYTSTNGTAWSQVSTFTASDFQFRCLATDGGGLWVTSSDFAEPTGIRYSYDGGVTWRPVVVPPSENGSTDPIHNIFYARGAGRFGVTWIDNPPTPTASGNFSMSLAVGETFSSIDGTILVPTVT